MMIPQPLEPTVSGSSLLWLTVATVLQRLNEMNLVGSVPCAASSGPIWRQRAPLARLLHTGSHSHVLQASFPLFQAAGLPSNCERPFSFPMTPPLGSPMTPSLFGTHMTLILVLRDCGYFHPIIALLLDNELLDGSDQSDFVRFWKNFSFVNFLQLKEKERCPENLGGGQSFIQQIFEFQICPRH